MSTHQPRMGEGTCLTQRTCGSVNDAYAFFGGSAPGLQRGETPLVVVPSRGNDGFHLSIPEGVFALVTRSGSYEGVYEPGFHYAPPWKKVSFLVTQQSVVFDTPVKECPTADNTMIEIDVVIVFHIVKEKVREFVYRLGPSSLDERLRKLQDEHLRGLALSKPCSEAYDLKDTSTKDMREAMNHQLEPFGVQIQDVTITNVRLPMSMVQTMQQQTIYASLNTYLDRKQEFELNEENNQNEILRLRQEHEERRLQLIDEGKRAVAEVNKEKSIVEADTAKMVADVNESKDADVLKIRAEGMVEIVGLNSDKKKYEELMKAKCEAAKTKIKADTNAYITKANAEADLKVSECNAKAIEQRARAEERARSALQARRKYEADNTRVEILEALARNKQAVIAGNAQGNVVAQMMAAVQSKTPMSVAVNADSL